MRIVIQRVTHAKVEVDGKMVSEIIRGLMILVGVECGDTADDARWLADKAAALRIFPRPGSDSDVMDCSVQDIGGEILAISQFTLTAGTRKGNRPSYIRAAKGPEAEPLYEAFCRDLEERLGRPTACGRFGADMQVSLTNDGPVTIIIDSRLRE